MTYQNANNFIVIEDDDRDPNTSWRHHVERGSAGGVDCVAPMRTKLYAPMACTVSSYWGGTGGLTIRMAALDGSGWVDEFMHCDEAPVSGQVQAREFVGYSGDSGGDYAPHVHWHRIAPGGGRRNPWHYFTAAPAGGNGAPITNQPKEEDDMKDEYIHWKDGGKQFNAIFNTISGYFSVWESSDGGYNTAVAQGYDIGGPTFAVTLSHARRIEADCAAVRAGR